MKQYRLLKDLPTFKAGDLFYISEYGALVYDDGGFGIMAYAQSTLEKFPNILTEWFEEIKEPVDSIHYKPKDGDEYFYVSDYGDVRSDIWRGYHVDNERLALGLVYPTEEACRKAKERKLAKVRLRRTSTFKPDFENGNGGYIVDYDYINKKLECCDCFWNDSGEIIRYETKEDAEKSIKENERDWKIYFGIDPSDTNES
jgi:hypothetical protein